MRKHNNAATQLEVASALIDSFLSLVLTGALNLDGMRAFGILSGDDWDELVQAVFAGDLARARTVLVGNDSSGLSAMLWARNGSPPLSARPVNADAREELEQHLRKKFGAPRANTSYDQPDPGDLIAAEPAFGEPAAGEKIADEHRAAREAKASNKKRPTR